MGIDVNNESGQAVDEGRLSRVAAFVLAQLHVHPRAELSVVLVDEPAIAELHERWMDEPGPTDVLSFPMDELRPGSEDEPTEPGLLGDVVLCPQVAARNAAQAGKPVTGELDLLLTHGILHLLGYDHADAEDARAMLSVQGHLLAAWQAHAAEDAARS